MKDKQVVTSNKSSKSATPTAQRLRMPIDRNHPTTAAFLLENAISSALVESAPISEVSSNSDAAMGEKSPARFQSLLQLRRESLVRLKPTTRRTSAAHSVPPGMKLAQSVDKSAVDESSVRFASQFSNQNAGNVRAGLSWRPAVSEAAVQREAKFYNFIFAKSDVFVARHGVNYEHQFPLVSVIQAPTHHNETVQALMGSASMTSFRGATLASVNNHLTGGDGSFFLQKALVPLPSYARAEESALIDEKTLEDEDVLRDTSLSLFFKTAVSRSFSRNGMVRPVSGRRITSREGSPTLDFSSRSSTLPVPRALAAVIADTAAAAKSPTIVSNLLRLCGNDRKYVRIPPTPQHPTTMSLYKAESYLLTEAFDCTLREYIELANRTGDMLHAPTLRRWCHQICVQLSEIHRAGVAHNILSASTVAITKADKPSSVHAIETQDAKLSWLYCATMLDLTMIPPLSKHTLSEQRADPARSELHVLATSLLPNPMAATPPEWHVVLRSPPGSPSKSTHAVMLGPGLKPTVVPTEASDVFLFGKMVQWMFTNSAGPFDPTAVPTLAPLPPPSADHPMWRKTEQPINVGRFANVSETGMNELRHLIMVSTFPDPKDRWKASECACHPFFWNTETKILFLELLVEMACPDSFSSSSEPANDNSRGKNAEMAIKKSMPTAPELASRQNTSWGLSAWLLQQRNWLRDAKDWFDAVCEHSDAALRYDYQNYTQDMLQFFSNVCYYMKNGSLPLKSIYNADVHVFAVSYLHRRFPMILMEALGMLMKEEIDAVGYVSLIARHMHTCPSVERAANLKTLFVCSSRLCEEVKRTLAPPVPKVAISRRASSPQIVRQQSFPNMSFTDSTVELPRAFSALASSEKD